MPVERLQKLLAAAGFGSRRACEGLIASGHVSVNGRGAILGDRADPTADEVTVDGVAVRFEQRTVVYLLNKPRGVITTAKDERGRRSVVDLVPDDPRVFPVGRLDRDSEGLLLLTNDGALANVVMHPSNGLVKTYVASVEGRVGAPALRRLRDGVPLEDGPARAVSARVLAHRRTSTLVEVRVDVGRNRIVRRMLDAVGHPARRLVRTAIGPLRDESLRPGEWRRLGVTEIASLEAAGHVARVARAVDERSTDAARSDTRRDDPRRRHA